MSIDKGMNKDVVCIYIHTHTIKYYSAAKKNEIRPLAATWMDLESGILSEESQRRNIV